MTARHPTRTNPPYWPGGIPSHIKCHSEPIPAEAWADEVKGWLLFLDENIVPRPDVHPPSGDELAVARRRRLVSQWASLSQADRDAYQSRAKPRQRRHWKPPVGTFKDDTPVASHTIHCVVPQPMSSRNRALLTKICILLYHLEGEDGPLISEDPEVVECVPNPASGPGVAVNPGQDFIMWKFVENADLNSMFMTSTGTVIMWGGFGAHILIDQEALDTGRVYLCSFDTNGDIHAGCHIRPQRILQDWWIYIIGLGWGVQNLIDEKDVWRSSRTSASPNGPLNMEQPILDILEDCKPWLAGGIDEWMDDIERIAPGYLDMEEAGNGMAPDYDRSKFRTEEQLASIPHEVVDCPGFQAESQAA